MLDSVADIIDSAAEEEREEKGKNTLTTHSRVESV
jgi:hypothetical protein